ncbi:MAG: hypothetical protein IPN65_04085 [Elusimicrobia bacterium]|nr:hypothetical protein [Elusimicrobiota bacterium]MBK7206838.1 hypothetical protein [Elusimicrobiota bacterium]MBK7545636.1 hypothetical protein [Elusimicrobiota bacterium]MBK7575174.1 hypothetical protein [Elusimicrobiota bacterium]MBK7687815.1 hypothetical protein [Elusimicrobiota bacterium]
MLNRAAKTGTDVGKTSYGCAFFPKCRYTQPLTSE